MPKKSKTTPAPPAKPDFKPIRLATMAESEWAFRADRSDDLRPREQRVVDAWQSGRSTLVDIVRRYHVNPHLLVGLLKLDPSVKTGSDFKEAVALYKTTMAGLHR